VPDRQTWFFTSTNKAREPRLAGFAIGSYWPEEP
jgi:hypothetical protein